jgi:TolB-like protein/class 3 adenylate cyclase/Flp pilus assembly protein TadD
MASTRRLAAIFAADVAGYSRLMGADEEGTHERLKAHLGQLVEPKIREHRGRIVKNTGDGMLAEFPSVVDAVRCAVEVQRGMIEREPHVPEERRIRFRIGVNLGDVIVEEHDIFGDGVNVAARLEGLAEPGGVCISRVVRDQIRDKLPYPFEDMGEQSVKNIARPVRVYAWRREGVAASQRRRYQSRYHDLTLRSILAPIGAVLAAALVIAVVTWWFWPTRSSPTATPAMAATTSIAQPLLAPRLSIVVLPFANLSNDPDQEYFADGVTEDLTTDLSRVQNMLVISRTSAFTYKNKPVNAKQIGRDLGVRYVVEGAVQRSSGQVRVNAQLINAETDAHLWAERFDYDIGNLFALQNEITSRLAHALGVELITAEVARHTERPDALDYILRGRAARFKPNSSSVYSEAIGQFEHALALDPQSADGQSLLAIALAQRAMDRMTDTRRGDIARAEVLAWSALATSPRNMLAHRAKAEVLRAQHRFEEAIPEYETVLSLDPNSAPALHGLSDCKLWTGSVDEVIPIEEQAIRLSPRDPQIAVRYRRIGLVHLLQSRTDEALRWLEKARGANPELRSVDALLASAYALRGETDRAAAELAEARRLSGPGSYASIARLRALLVGVPKIRALFEDTYFAGLRKAGVPEE